MEGEKWRDIPTVLLSMADPGYRDFQAKLLPGSREIMGVRLPALRKLAKGIAGEDFRDFLDSAQEEYFEEVMLKGMVIGCADMEFSEALLRIAWFVPRIGDWSVCDSFCAGLKTARGHKDEMWKFLEPYVLDSREFFIRFGVVMLLFYYIEDQYVDRVLDLLGKTRTQERYAAMAVAWAVSACYTAYPEKTFGFLDRGLLDDFTHNMALQKSMESLKTGSKARERLRERKRRSPSQKDRQKGRPGNGCNLNLKSV